jgi:N-acylneuraminate cytidylyltransferase
MAPVIRHALAYVEETEDAYDAVVLLDPTSPSRDPSHVDSAIARLFASTADGIVAVSEPTFHPSFVGVRDSGDGRLTRYYAEGVGTTRRQEVDRFLRINGNFYVWRAAFVRRLGTSWFDEGEHDQFEIPESHSFSIDDRFEFQVIESLWTSGLIALPAAARTPWRPAADRRQPAQEPPL